MKSGVLARAGFLIVLFAASGLSSAAVPSTARAEASEGAPSSDDAEAAEADSAEEVEPAVDAEEGEAGPGEQSSEDALEGPSPGGDQDADAPAPPLTDRADPAGGGSAQEPAPAAPATLEAEVGETSSSAEVEASSAGPATAEGSSEATDASAPPEGPKAKGGITEDDDNAAAALGAANPVVAANTGKPWQVMGEVGTSLGSSTFARNQQAQFGYNLALTGLYRLAPFLDGRLDALLRVAADQVLVEGFESPLGSTRPNEFFFRDVRVGVLGRGLYRVPALGLVIGANTSFDLPTSEQAQFWGRIVRWNIGVNAVDMLTNVGPGNLLMVAFLTFRKDFGQTNPTVPQFTDDGSRIAVCRSTNQDDAGNCFTDVAPLDFSLIYGGSLRYFLGTFSVGAGLTLLSNFSHDLGESEIDEPLAATGDTQLGSSINALDAPPHALLAFTSIDVTYVFNANFNLSAGINSFQVPIRYQGNNPRAVVSPLFDSPERNATNLFLNATVMY